jgi:hypothetical protein
VLRAKTFVETSSADAEAASAAEAGIT